MRAVARGQCVARRQRNQLIAPGGEERIVDDEKRVDPLLDETRMRLLAFQVCPVAQCPLTLPIAAFRAQGSLSQLSASNGHYRIAEIGTREGVKPSRLVKRTARERISVETKRDEEQLDYQPNAQRYKGAHGNPHHDADTVKGFRHFCR